MAFTSKAQYRTLLKLQQVSQQVPGTEPSSDEGVDLISIDEDQSVVPAFERPPNTSVITAVGRVASVSQQHFDLLGNSNVTLHLEQLPWNATDPQSTASCAFLPYSRVAELRSEALQVLSPHFLHFDCVLPKHMDMHTETAHGVSN